MQSNSNTQQMNSFNGRWNEDEHHRFLTGIMKFGKDWKLVQEIVKTRTGSQVRSHAQKFFLKLQKIQKQRRKQRNKHKQQKTQTQKEILEYINPMQITDQTPSQIIALLKADESTKKQARSKEFIEIREKEQADQLENPSKIPEKQDQIVQLFKNRPQILHSGQNIKHCDSEMIKQLLTAYKNMHEDDQDHQDSFLICLFKTNKDYFLKGNDFTSLIDFGKEKVTALEQENYSQPQQHTRKRKRSFTIPGDEQNQSKLQETLQSIRKMLKRN